MNTRRLLFPFTALLFALPLAAADKPAGAKPGYTVVLDVKIDEKGLPEDAQIVSSDDTTLDHTLEQAAFAQARALQLPPRIKDGHAVKFTARAPFVFPVEGDEGAEANNAPKPKISKAQQPVYPADLAAQGEVGGAILEVVIGADGRVSSLKVLRSSHPAFAQAATAAVNQWVFVPAKSGDQPVESRWRMSLSFETDVRAVDWIWRVPPRPSLGNYTVVHRTLPPETPAPVETKPAAPPAGK